MATALAKQHQVWVLTSKTHRVATEVELARHPQPNLHVVDLDPFGWVLDWSGEGSQWASYPHYYSWQVWAYFVGQSLHRQVGFDIVHHVTYGKYSTPSFLSLLPIPFFLGPVGGGESAPKAFWTDFSPRARMYEILRGWARQIGEWDPFVCATVRRSLCTWASTDETARRLHHLGAQHVRLSSQAALDQSEAQALAQLPLPELHPMRFISMGRLLHWKGFHLGLRAFACAGLPDAEYWILGDGPEREPLEAIGAELGITNQVKFWGKLDRHHALSRLGECHVLLHPSLHDAGGWVCLEAMAAGRPVICLDLGGPAVLVTAECGYQISAHTPAQAVKDLAVAMTRLAGDRDLCGRMGRAGQRRVKEHLSWDHYVESAVREYQKVI
jgi:glycosyltransferase involved in cell wall biosynthesis